MRWQLLAVGRLKAGPERELVERYRVRADALGRSSGFGALDIVELPEARARTAAERIAAEAAAVLARTAGTKLVAFDERGQSISSDEFAGRLRDWRDGGAPMSFVIGGSDGLDDSVRRRADFLVSFGRLTLPHQIVRILAAEQIYRALTILAGHPYHRGEPGGE
ncbi:23S rRNA (pseudouridine(1915)-N(3))-methyltransferase RlmH [Enterovirga aerilata]|uniref:Ribosomal RNA large subunit methyltransferase H n=1 Tax=Enterovirga aerilata TaxID=2730920 RepID=A0A849I0Q2_9HYPH|nr:23S rRNA (pseudouridine(1915)-N(3))-methyltransferase RlmH [Enterovirga sp. DB1703]